MMVLDGGGPSWTLRQGLDRWWANEGTSATKFSTGPSATHGDEALAVVQGGIGVGSAELHVLIQLASRACTRHVKG